MRIELHLNDSVFFFLPRSHAAEKHKEAGVTVEIEPISTEEFNSPTARPMNSILDNKALRERHNYHMKDWKDALHEYMCELDK